MHLFHSKPLGVMRTTKWMATCPWTKTWRSTISAPSRQCRQGVSWSIVRQSESTCLWRSRLVCQGRPNYVFRQLVPYPPMLFHVYRKLWPDPHPCPVMVVTRAVKIAWYVGAAA